MGVERDMVKVRCPATTANMGPGFDCIGMAVDLWNELTVRRSDRFEMIIEGEGADVLPRDQSNLVVTGIEEAFKAAGKTVPTLSYHLLNRIPFARGLGSSSAAIVAGLIAGLVLAGHELPVTGQEQLLQLAASIEGHPDNVAPAIYGGLQLGINADGRWWTKRITVPAGLQLILFVPDRVCETSEARALLPEKISRADAIFNMGRTALLVHSFQTGNLDDLRMATEDKLHQPPRSSIMPFLYPLVQAALKAGAHGAFLSGAGPTVMAITSGRKGDIYAQEGAERKEKEVAEAMKEVAKGQNVSGRLYISRPTEYGAYVVAADPPIDKYEIVTLGDDYLRK